MLSKSLIQLSVDGQGCVPSLLFGLRPNYGGGDEENGTHCPTQCPQPCSSHRPPTPLLGTAGHSRGGLGQSLVGSLLLSPGPGAHKVLSVPSKSLFPSPVSVLVALWWG